MPGSKLAHVTASDAQRRSLRGLDALNFLMADVRDGLGPYLAVFLRGAQRWAPDRIGIAMAASSLSAAACQIPAGFLSDAVHHKRLAIGAAAIAVAAGCLLIAWHPVFPMVVLAQIVLGGASALIPPLIGGLSLGLVGPKRFDARIARNESFNHAGNFIAAGVAGCLGQYVGYRWLFYLVCAFAAGSAMAVRLIDPARIDHEVARGSRDGEQPIGVGALVRRPGVLVFLASVVLFHFGNAAMLPLAGQVLAQKHPRTDTIALSACIIAAQVVMIGAASTVGRLRRNGLACKTIYLAALVVLPIRGVLFTIFDSPIVVVAIQLLDGIAAGIFGVVSVLIAAQLTRGTGRFNLALGLTALSVGIGAALSNATAGLVVKAHGFHAGFIGLTGIATIALVFTALALRSEP